MKVIPGNFVPFYQKQSHVSVSTDYKVRQCRSFPEIPNKGNKVQGHLSLYLMAVMNTIGLDINEIQH